MIAAPFATRWIYAGFLGGLSLLAVAVAVYVVFRWLWRRWPRATAGLLGFVITFGGGLLVLALVRTSFVVFVLRALAGA